MRLIQTLLVATALVSASALAARSEPNRMIRLRRSSPMVARQPSERHPSNHHPSYDKENKSGGSVSSGKPDSNASSKPSASQLLQAYGSVPDGYAPTYDPNGNTPCTYDAAGWLTSASQHGCPVKIQPPQTGGNGSGNGSFDADVNAADNDKVNVGSSNSEGVLGGSKVGSSWNGPKPPLSNVQSNIGASHHHAHPPSGGVGSPSPGGSGGAGGSAPGGTQCSPGGSGSLNVNLIDCSTVCVLDVNCPKLQKSCTIPSADGSLLDVTALDCTPLDVLSSN